jgi:hypothetical protein
VPHLFEHMLFKGYRGPGDRRFASEAAAMRAGFNGTTAEELVTYYLSGPSDAALGAVQLLAGLVREPRFEPEDLRTERFVVLGELQRGRSDPQDQLRTARGAHALGGAAGRARTRSASRGAARGAPAQLREIYGRYYVPNNAALVVTGDVDADRVVEAARRHFGSWRRRPDPFAAARWRGRRLAASQSCVCRGRSMASTVTLSGRPERGAAGGRRHGRHAGRPTCSPAVVNDEARPRSRDTSSTRPVQCGRLLVPDARHTGPCCSTRRDDPQRLRGAHALVARWRRWASTATDRPQALATRQGPPRGEPSWAERGPARARARPLGYWWWVRARLPRGYDRGSRRRRAALQQRFVGATRSEAAVVAAAPSCRGAERGDRAMLRQFAEFTRRRA